MLEPRWFEECCRLAATTVAVAVCVCVLLKTTRVVPGSARRSLLFPTVETSPVLRRDDDQQREQTWMICLSRTLPSVELGSSCVPDVRL